MVKVETVVAKVKAEKVGEIKVIQEISRYRGNSYRVEGQAIVGAQTYNVGYYNKTVYLDKLDTNLLKNLGFQVDFSDIQKEVDNKIEMMENERMILVRAERNAQYDNYLKIEIQLNAAGIANKINTTREEYVKHPYNVEFNTEFVYKGQIGKWTIAIEEGRYKLTKRFGDYKLVGRYGKMANLITKITDQKTNFISVVEYEIAQDARKNNAEEIMKTELNAKTEAYSYNDNMYKIGEDYDNRIVFKPTLNTETNENKYTIKELPNLSAYQMNKIIEILGLNKSVLS